MRRVLATLGLILAASSTVSTVSAEVKMGAWGRGFFIPFITDGDSTQQAIDAVSWGAGNPRVGATISGSSDNVGFQIDLNGDGGSINAGDQQKIWAKPFSFLTVSVGRAYDDALRGNGTFGDFDWLRITGTGEDLTFARMSTYDGPQVRSWGEGQGAIIALDPVKEMHAYIGFKNLKTMKVAEAYKNLQIGAGYNIAEKAHIRAQYIGIFTDSSAGKKAVDKSNINAALKLTLSESFYADLGTFIAMKKEEAGYSAIVAAYLRYSAGAIALHGLGKFAMGVKDLQAKDATGMEFALGFNYAIGDKGLGLVSSFRYQNEAAAGVKDGRIGALVGIEKGFSNGKVGIGVEFSTTNMAFYGESGKGNEKATIALPVKVEYWF